MSKIVQIRRGTTNEHNQFTGAMGEITMDTDANTLRVHDGKTVGGVTLARADKIPTVPDISGYDFVTETNVVGTTWYRKYKSGWVEQGGKLDIGTIAATTGINQTVTMVKPMANTNFSVNLSCASTAAEKTVVELINNRTVNSVQIRYYNSAGNSVAINHVFWSVFGMAA